MSKVEWKDNSTELYDILFHRSTIVPITLPSKLPFRSGVGWLSMEGSTLVRFENARNKKRTTFHISNVNLRKLIGADKQSIWRIQLTKDSNSGENDLITDAEYTIERYRFPRLIPWMHKLPIYIPDALQKKWDLMLRGAQLIDRLIFSQNTILFGMSLVGNFETDDERSVSIWTNTGEVLIFEVDAFYLRLKRLVTISDREELSFHPNTLLKLENIDIQI